MAHPSDSKNFTDLSGLAASATQYDNPYDSLLDACDNDPRSISTLYATHRSARNTQQRSKLLAPAFKFSIDPILSKLLDPKQKPGYEDPRHCLVFWARPSQRVRGIIEEVQGKLGERFPSLWLMPPSNLHTTVLEIAHSRTAGEIEAMVSRISPQVEDIVNYTRAHHAGLIKPMISYDGSALALSFVPDTATTYTYHHLRRDIYKLASNSGVEVASRYVVPSAHLTIARWVDQRVVEKRRVGELVDVLEQLNAELEGKYWGDDGNAAGLRWQVGEEKGLVCRRGQVWYGGGESFAEGKGF